MRFTIHAGYWSALTFCATSGLLSVQSALPPNAAAILDSPALRPNASILQHNPLGSPIGNALATARSGAPARGIAWKGIDILSPDDASIMVGVTDSALLDILKKRVCLADAVVTGHTIAERSHQSAYGTAVYTDYLFVVHSVLKDNVRSPIREQVPIVVTRVGGSIVLPDGPVRYMSVLS